MIWIIINQENTIGKYESGNWEWKSMIGMIQESKIEKYEWVQFKKTGMEKYD